MGKTRSTDPSQELPVKPFEIASRRFRECLRAKECKLENLLLQGNRFLQKHGVGDEAISFAGLVSRASPVELRCDVGSSSGMITEEDTIVMEAIMNSMIGVDSLPFNGHSPTVRQFAEAIWAKWKTFKVPLPESIAEEVAKRLAELKKTDDKNK